MDIVQCWKVMGIVMITALSACGGGGSSVPSQANSETLLTVESDVGAGGGDKLLVQLSHFSRASSDS